MKKQQGVTLLIVQADSQILVKLVLNDFPGCIQSNIIILRNKITFLSGTPFTSLLQVASTPYLLIIIKNHITNLTAAEQLTNVFLKVQSKFVQSNRFRRVPNIDNVNSIRMRFMSDLLQPFLL